MFETISKGQQALTRGLVLCAGWALFLFTFVVTINVLTRKLLSVSLQGVDEYGGYLLAIAGAIGFSQAALERAHIRIDIAARRLPLSLRSLMISLALASLLLTIGYLSWHAFALARQSFQMGAMATSVLRTQLWVPQSLWVAALVWCALVVLLQLLQSLKLVLKGRWQDNIDAFDTPTVEDDVQREMDELRTRQRRAADGESL